MENRALVVLFSGESVPENVVERISREISTWCSANIEKMSIHELNETDIIKTIVEKCHHVNDASEKCKTCDDAIIALSKIINLDSSVPLFAINLSTMLMRVLDRENTIGLTMRDKELIKALNVLGHGGPRSKEVCDNYFYTKEIDKALREIYKRIFDENGKIKK